MVHQATPIVLLVCLVERPAHTWVAVGFAEPSKSSMVRTEQLKLPNKRHPAYRTDLRTIRQGGTGRTQYFWYRHTIGACENWKLHTQNDTENLLCERYRAIHVVGNENERGMLTSGKIHSPGSMCGPCAVAIEAMAIHALRVGG